MAVATLVAVSACGLVANLGEYDGYTQYPDDASLVSDDTGTGPGAAVDAVSPLVGLEAAAQRADGPNAAPDDAGPGVRRATPIVEPGSWCATLSPVPDYCRDFDTWNALDHWTSTDIVLENVYTNPDPYTSAPLALLIHGKPMMKEQHYSDGRLSYSVPWIPKRIRFAYDFKLVTPPDDECVFQAILVGPHASAWSLKMEIGGGGTDAGSYARIQEYTQPIPISTYHEFSQGQVPGTTGWTRVAFDVKLDLAVGGQSSFSLTFDGMPILTDETVNPPGYEALPGDAGDPPTTTVDVGVDYAPAPSTSGFQFFVDNAVIYFD